MERELSMLNVYSGINNVTFKFVYSIGRMKYYIIVTTQINKKINFLPSKISGKSLSI